MNPGELQVSQNLSPMNRENFSDGFYFDQHRLVHDHIDAVSAIQLDAAVVEGQGYLPYERNPPKEQFTTEAGLVSRFQ